MRKDRKLIQTIRIYSQDIGMEFDIEKFTMLMKSEKQETAEGIKQPNKERIRTLGE